MPSDTSVSKQPHPKDETVSNNETDLKPVDFTAEINENSTRTVSDGDGNAEGNVDEIGAAIWKASKWTTTATTEHPNIIRARIKKEKGSNFFASKALIC